MTTSLSDAGLQFADGNIQTYPVVAVRQTVLSGPVDTNGLPAFGGATGSATVTVSGTLVATAANGMTNRTGSKTAPSWPGLSTNGTMYPYFDVNADNTLTEGSGTLAPIYQFGGTPAVTSGQFTYNIQEAKGYIGNGTTAVAGYRVYVGEVTVAAGVVSAIVWYAINGAYVGPYTATMPAASTGVSANHNIGWSNVDADFECQCTTINNGFAVGDVEVNPLMRDSSGTQNTTSKPRTNRLAAFFGVNDNASFPFVQTPKTGGTATYITPASWQRRIVARRKWL